MNIHLTKGRRFKCTTLCDDYYEFGSNYILDTRMITTAEDTNVYIMVEGCIETLRLYTSWSDFSKKWLSVDSNSTIDLLGGTECY